LHGRVCFAESLRTKKIAACDKTEPWVKGAARNPSSPPDVSSLRAANERRLKMNRPMKQGLIATVLLTGVTLLSGPTYANSIHDEGYFGGSYTSIGPGPYYLRRGPGRIGPLHEGRVYAYRPVYGAYGYKPAYYGDYGYGPYDSGPAPGFGIGIY
jgi:hypothetical protein